MAYLGSHSALVVYFRKDKSIVVCKHLVEDECEDVADCDTCLVGSFKTPPGHLLQPPPEQVSNGLKGKKIAYKFEIEWGVGTFKCMYKGKNSKYKGHATVCFGRNCTMYLDLELSKYGMGADWVIIKKSN